MGFLQDNLFPFLKKRDVMFLESYQESNDVYSFRFEKTKDLTWKAGQYGLFTVTHKKIKNPTRPFTVSSAPTENVVQFTTVVQDTPSEFKKAMLELKQGMTVNMRGPVGPFYLENNDPTIFIAGGMGITPFRSILKQIEAEGSGGERQIHLLYMDSEKTYLFKDELDEMAGQTSLRVSYLDSRNDLHQEIDEFTTLNKNKANYFIAGPKSMADSLFSYLQNHGISKKNIKKDAFFGY